MKLRIALHLLLLATLCMGCGGRRHMRQLESLEAQLDTAPHLVRQSIDSIPFTALRGEARALYALLRTQADYKCYVPLTSDSLIRYATDYYDGNRKSYRTAEGVTTADLYIYNMNGEPMDRSLILRG